MEARRGDISVPSKPMIKSWPIADVKSRISCFQPGKTKTMIRSVFSAHSASRRLNFFLQLCQQVQRVQRSQPVQIDLTQFFHHWLRQRCKDGQLRWTLSL